MWPSRSTTSRRPSTGWPRTATGWSATLASTSTYGAWPTCAVRKGSSCPWPSGSADLSSAAPTSPRTPASGYVATVLENWVLDQDSPVDQRRARHPRPKLAAGSGRPVEDRRIQAVVATMGLSGSNSRRCMAFAGVSPPSVLRGRALSSVATSSSRAGECTNRSVPLGKYWRSTHSVLVGASLPRRVGVTEVDVHLGGQSD